MHLKSLRIENFRILEQLKVEKLGRVNLIVGRNNIGKSTVLEALQVYATKSILPLLEEISLRHDESTHVEDVRFDSQDVDLPFEHFFTGRKFPDNDGREIYIGEAKENPNDLTIAHILFIEEEVKIAELDGDVITGVKRTQISKSHSNSDLSSHPKHGLKITRHEQSKIVDIEQQLNPNVMGIRRALLSERDSLKFLPCSIIPTDFVTMDDLAEIWESTLFTEYSEIIKTALSLIDSSIEDLAFVKIKNRPYERTAKLKIKHEKRAVPLKSMGDGMRRILQLALKAVPAKNGFLLIDELENGLHYSVQEKVWNLLFELAEKFNIGLTQ